jgi:hypothetical protein
VRTYLKKKPLQKETGGAAEGVGPEFKPQYPSPPKKAKFGQDMIKQLLRGTEK